MEPKDFARVLLRRKRTVLTATIIVAVTALVGSYRKPPVYLASCSVMAQPIVDPSDPNARSVEPLGSLETYKTLLTSPDVARRAAKIMKAASMPPLHVEIQPETAIFDLQSFTGNAQVAGDACNAYAEAFLQMRRDAAEDFFTRQLRKVEKRQIQVTRDLRVVTADLRHARSVGDEEQELRYLNQRNNLLESDGDLRKRHTDLTSALTEGVAEGGQIIKPAGPGAREGGNHKRDLLLGLLVGLMFGIGIALVREYLDDTVKDKESTQRELGLPVLATMPDEGLDTLVETSSATVEAARGLRATLGSLGFPHDKQMLMVTSTLSKGRATTLASLAAAVAESGRSVLVIGSDLRAGRTHEAFGVANTLGLANVVRGQVPMERAIRPAPGLDGVFVLPCGPIIGNPGEVLSSEGMALLLRRARRWADVVILDAPPVLAAADASVLGAYADGVVLVVSAGLTNRSQANEAKEQLVAAGARVLGAVLIGGEDTGRPVSIDGGYGDLPPLVPYGGAGAWGGFEAGYDDPGAYGDYYDEGALTATARMGPRASSARRAPQKKTAAARPGQRPKASAAKTTVPRNARTTQRSRARASTNGKRATAGSAAPKRTAAGSRSTSKKAAPLKRTPARASTARASTKSVRATIGNGARTGSARKPRR